jgi:AraC-like DNA-binding protein
MDEARSLWYFSTMATPPVRFDRRKYGRHLLIDVARIRGLKGFITDAPHALDFYEIMLVTRGKGTIDLDSVTHGVRPGTVLFTTPGQVRDWHVPGLDGLCLFFEEDFVTEFLNDAAFIARLPFFHTDPRRAALSLPPAKATLLRRRLDAMRAELAHYERDSLDLLRAQLHEILIVLARDYAVSYRVAPQQPANPLVSRFLALVERDVARRHRVSDYADELAVTTGHLSALCAEYRKKRAKQIIDDALVTRARRLLLYTDDSIARIGLSLGFDDPSYFSRFFRRETGQSPAELRAGQNL